MARSVFCLPVLIAVVCLDQAYAEQVYDIAPFYSRGPDRQFAPSGPPGGNLRWRPLEAETGGRAADKPQNGAAAGYGGGFDYTDEPFGLPPGTYRQIEQRHTITPHLEGYRFRPIDPEEQLRNRDRNKAQERASRDRANPPPQTFRGAGGFRPQGQQPALKFRPDPRLDKRSGRAAPPRYAFPMGSEAPMFRPQ